MNERENGLVDKFEKDILDVFTEYYGVSGAEKLLVRKTIQTVSNQIQTWEGRSIDVRDIFDIELELKKYGFEEISKDHLKLLLKYGDQLVWEGENFGKPDRKKAGEAIIKRVLLGKDDTRD